MEGGIILEGSKKVLGWLAKNWNAITETKETKEKKQLENVDKKIKIVTGLTEEQRKAIGWKLDRYKELGLSDDEIKEKVLPEVEKNTDPMSVIQQLAKKGAILDIAEEPGDDEQPPALTE